jgi:hypothetical protein
MTYVITTLLKRKRHVGKLNWSSLPSTSSSNTLNLCVQGRSYVSWRPGRVIKLADHRRNCEIQKKKIYISLSLNFIWLKNLKFVERRDNSTFILKDSFFPSLYSVVGGGRTTPAPPPQQPGTPLCIQRFFPNYGQRKTTAKCWLQRR